MTGCMWSKQCYVKELVELQFRKYRGCGVDRRRVWYGCVCKTGRGVLAVQTRIDGIDKGKAVFDGTKAQIKMRGVRRKYE